MLRGVCHTFLRHSSGETLAPPFASRAEDTPERAWGSWCKRQLRAEGTPHGAQRHLVRVGGGPTQQRGCSPPQACQCSRSQRPKAGAFIIPGQPQKRVCVCVGGDCSQDSTPPHPIASLTAPKRNPNSISLWPEAEPVGCWDSGTLSLQPVHTPSVPQKGGSLSTPCPPRPLLLAPAGPLGPAAEQTLAPLPSTEWEGKGRVDRPGARAREQDQELMRCGVGGSCGGLQSTGEGARQG